MRDYETVIKKLNARPTGGGWHVALCPFHPDRNPSLTFNSDRYVCLVCGMKGPLADLLDVGTLGTVVNTPELDRRERRRILRTARLQRVAELLRHVLPD